MKTSYISKRIRRYHLLNNCFIVCLIFGMLLFGIPSFIVGMLFTYLLVSNITFYHYINMPYSKITDVYKKVITGYTLDDVYRMRNNLSPEIAGVFSVVQDLMESKEMIDASKKQAEYIALQNQINPHFLYNTLESIRSEAIIEGLESVAEITEILASFYRYTISNVDTSVTLQSEVDHINAYFSIQRFRFGDKLSLTVNVDSDLDVMEAYIPKLILQPIVENAIYHGLERKVGSGTVSISIVVIENDINIRISDNGVGMKAKQLRLLEHKLNSRSYNYLQQDSQESTGIALVNVNTRLMLLYGEDYQLNVWSTENVGTDVEVNIPINWSKDNEKTSR